MIRRKTFNKVLDHFNGDITKAIIWFKIPNTLLHGLKPQDYAFMGKHEYLDRMVDCALEEST